MLHARGTHHKHKEEQCLLHVLLSSTNWPRVLHPTFSSNKRRRCCRHKAAATAHSSFSFSKTIIYIWTINDLWPSQCRCHLAFIENITNYLDRWGWTRHSDLVQPPWRLRSSYSDAFCDPDTQPGFLWLLSRSLGRLLLCLKQRKGKIYFCKRNVSHRVLVGKPAGKRPLGRPRRRWKDNIKMDLWEVG